MTEAPEHKVVEEAEILTAGVTDEFTIIDTVLEVAVGVLGQAAVVVITQDTISPLFNTLDENVGPVAVFVPFTFH